jgi:hypothetical protein
MAPINTLHTILKRSDSSCDSYYGNTCSSHRTAILIIIIAVGFLTTAILLFYYLRKRTSVHPGPSRFKAGLVHPQKLQRREARATWRREDRYEGDVGLELPRYEEKEAKDGRPTGTGMGDAPPPYVYVLARPEDVYSVDGRRL